MPTIKYGTGFINHIKIVGEKAEIRKADAEFDILCYTISRG